MTRPWVAEGTEVLIDAVDRLSDTALRSDSGLPGWTRAHVVAHVARNAEALVRLAAWARTGIETPMYADADQRAADIESSSDADALQLRSELASTAVDLETALDRLDPAGWRAPVRSALGREMAAAEIPWMRVREVWLHAVDLAADVRVEDLPADLVDALLDDVTATMTAREDVPPYRLDAVDRDRDFEIGTAGLLVRGTAAALLGWVTGRTSGADLSGDGDLPPAPRWI